MGIRRVVTGQSAEGKAILASDEVVAPVRVALLPGYEFLRLWGADSPPLLPDDGSQPPGTDYFPPVGGFRFGLFTVPPDGDTVVQNGTRHAWHNRSTEPCRMVVVLVGAPNGKVG